LKKPACAAKATISDEKLLSVFSLTDPITKDQAIHAMGKLGASRDAARNAFSRFDAEELILAAEPPRGLEKKRGPKPRKYLKNLALSEGEINSGGAPELFSAN
jgi:hypothetical protein